MSGKATYYVLKEKAVPEVLLKVMEAKRLIDEEKLNFTEISEKLNFSSPYYFTKVFKKSVGLSPSEYKKKDISL